MMSVWKILLVLGTFALSVVRADFETNSIEFINPPQWLTESKVDTTVKRVESFLEWDIRRVRAYYYSDPSSFETMKKRKIGPSAVAFFRKADSTLHIGPKVTEKDFDRIFAHECVHVIFFQKYKKAIPEWLEEGLANYVGRMNKVDYKWLATQSIPDVKKLHHPYQDTGGSKLHYAISTALIEMIVSRCNLTDLLQLSVGRSMEQKLVTYCEIPDINTSFKDWVKKKAG